MRPVLLLIVIFCLISRVVFGQQSVRSIGDYTTFTIPFEGDSVTFAVVAKQGELVKKKPIFLSGIPLLVNDGYLDTLLNTRGNPDMTMYPPHYLQHNYLDYYVRQTNAVLAFLLKQPWADARRVVLAGGSEGYEVALKTAYTNPAITHLIAISGSLDGRMQGQIREERMKGYTGEYTQEEAQRSVEGMQQLWATICRDSLNTTAQGGDPYKTTYSFSHSHNLDYLLALNIPILIIYGTADVAATSNDMLPMEFARRGKTNLTLKAYPNHDHTYHKLTYGPDGKVVSKAYNGVAVERDYFEWLKAH